MSGKKRPKQAAAAHDIHQEKKVESRVPVHVDRHLTWSFVYADIDWDFGWKGKDLPEDLFKEIIPRLQGLETQTWPRVITEAGRRNHYVAASEVIPDAQKRLAVLVKTVFKEDVDDLFSMGIDARRRVWGLVRDGVFTIWWWDPQHQICPSELKNT